MSKFFLINLFVYYMHVVCINFIHTHTSYFCFPGELKLIQCALGMRIGTETEKIRAKFSTPGNQGKVLETNLRLDQ